MITKLASAIATAEGFFHPDPQVRPRRNHNPGNLTASPLNRPKDPAFVIFKSDQEGVAALYNQIARHILRGYSLRTLITKWAPPHENDTENYIRETARRCEIDDIDKPLWEYLELKNLR